MSMISKKSLLARHGAEASALIPIVAEPSAGQHDQNLASFIERLGGRNVRILAAGYISASVPVDAIDEIAQVARIELKPKKEPLRMAL
jgi:hypothetical protein